MKRRFLAGLVLAAGSLPAQSHAAWRNDDRKRTGCGADGRSLPEHVSFAKFADLVAAMGIKYSWRVPKQPLRSQAAGYANDRKRDAKRQSAHAPRADIEDADEPRQANNACAD